MADRDVISTLNTLIETCRDGEQGFREAAQNIRTAPSSPSSLKSAGNGRSSPIGEIGEDTHREIGEIGEDIHREIGEIGELKDRFSNLPDLPDLPVNVPVNILPDLPDLPVRSPRSPV